MNLSKNILSRLTVFIPLTFYAIIITWQYHLPSLSTDGHTYLQIARNIHYGIGLGWQALWATPLYSVLIASLAWIAGTQDLIVVAGVVSILMGALLTVSIYFLSAEIFDRRVAVMASITSMSFPHVISMIFTSEPEITYAAFLTTSLALLLVTIEKSSFPLGILTGIAFSLAYLSRSEGFLVMVLTLSIICATQGLFFYKNTLTKLCLTVMIFFILTSSPYLYFLKQHYGAFVISPKATYVMIWMKSKIYHDNNKGELQNDELWGLTPEGKLKWQQPSGISDLTEFLLSHPAKSLSVYLDNLSYELPGRIPNSSGTLHFPQVYPIYIAVLALLAAFYKWGDSSMLKKAVLFAPFLILLILPIFTGGWCKYLSPYAPLLFIAACGGLSLFAEQIMIRTESLRFRTITKLIPVGTVVILVTCFLSVFIKNSTPETASESQLSRNKNYENTRNAGLMARRLFGPGRNYMVQWSKMIYYLDGLWTPMPVVTSHEQVLDFAHRNNVEYVIWQFQDRTVTDEVLVKEIPQGFKLAGIFRSEDLDYCAAFYELINAR